MKTRTAPSLPAARTLAALLAGSALALAALPTAARAATFSWKGGGGNNNWSNAANWVGNTPPPSDLVNTDLLFGATAAVFPSIDSPYSIHSLTWNAGASAYTYDSGPLTLGAGGFTQNATNAEAFGAPVILGAAQTWTLASGAGQLTFGNGVNTTNGGTSYALTINAATTTGSGNAISGAITGSGSLTKLGAGTLTLNGASIYTGGTTLAGGTVGAGNDMAFGTGGVSTTANMAVSASGADHTLGNTFALGTGTTLAINAAQTGVHNLTLNGTITGAGGVSINVAGGTVTFGGAAANSYAGLTTVTAGTLVLNKDNGALAIGGNLSIGNATNAGATGSVVVRQAYFNELGTGTGVAIYPDGVLDAGGYSTYVGPLTMTGGQVLCGTNGNLLRLTGDVNVNASASGSLIQATYGNSVLLNGGTRTFTVADGLALYDLDIRASVTQGTLIKAGPGTLRLAGSPDLGGFTVMESAGTLALANDGVFGPGGSFTLAGGTVVADGTNRTLSNPVNVTASATVGSSVDGTPRSFTFTGATSLATNATLTVSNNAATTFSGVVSGAGGLVKTGVGMLTLGNAANTFTGGLTLNGGTLAIAADGSLGGPVNAVTFNVGTLQFTGSVTTARTFLLSNASILSPGAGNTLTYASGASVNGGFLGAGGTHAFAGGSALNGTTALIGSALSQAGGTTAWDNVTLRGNFTQTGGTLNATDGLTVTTSGTLAVGGTTNLVNGGEVDGVATVNGGGTLATGTGNLYLGGGSRTTINSGGTLTAASGTSIELNGALLINNGTQNGNLNVNYGSSARGTGFFGNVTVGTGGQFGNNGVAGGGNLNAVNAAPAATSFWQALDRAQQLSAAPLPFIGPQLSTTPQVTNVANLTLGAGSTFNFNLQNTQEPAGTGYDLTNVGNQLTLTGSTTPGNQIVIRLISLDGNGNNGTVASFDPTQGYAFTLVHTANGIVGYTAGEFTVNTASFINSTQGGTFSVVQNGNDLVLMFAPVPEPGTWALLAIGVGGLLLVVRRRQRGC